MPETPRFSVSGNDLIDASTGKVLTPNEFNQRATPAEKDAIARELTARSQMANQTSEDQIDETAIDEDLATGPAVAPVGSRATMTPVPSQTASTPVPESAPIPQSEPLTEAPRRPAGAPPSLPEYLEKARPLNPEFDDREIAIEYRKQFPDANKFYPPPPKDQWIAKAKEVNPEADDTELNAFYTDVYGEPEKRSEYGDVARGFIESVKQVPQLAYGLLAGAGAVGEKLFGEGGGASNLKRFGVENYRRISDDLAKDAKLTDSLNYSFDRAKEGDYGALVDWLQHGFGYVGGQAIQLLATGAVGGLAGKAALQTTAETIAKKAVEAETKTLLAQSAGKLGADEVAKLAVANVAKNMGQTLAVGATAVGMEGGEIFGDLTSDAAKQGRQLSGAELAKAGVMTAFAGLLEFAGDKIGLDLMLGKSPITKALGAGTGVAGRLAKGVEAGAIAAVPEAATEFGQTVVEEWGKGHDPVGSVSPETLRQAQDAAGIGALGGALVGGTAGALRPGGGAEPPPEEPATTPPSATPLETVAPVLQAQSVDEAIASAAKIVEQPAVTSAQLDTAIGVAPVSPALSYTDAHLSTDQVAFERVVAGRSQGDAVRVIDPKTLPAQTEPTEGMSQEKYDALSVMAQAFGKRLVVFEAGANLPNGAFWQSQDPSRIYLASSTQGEDAFVVFAHEAMHTMQGTALYESYKQVIRQQVTPDASKVAEIRHGEDLSGDQLVEEMAADIGSNELQKPEMWEKVFAHMREQVGDEQAKVEVVGFIDSLKQIIQRIKSMIATRQLTVRGKTLTELYVQDLEKVQDALAQAVGNTLYNKKFATPEQAKAVGKLSMSRRQVSDRTVLPKDVAETFSTVASLQREKPEAAMRAVQKATGHGLMANAVEQTGDLLHRMTEGSRAGTSNRLLVKEKVDKLLTSLTHAYGFEKEHAENLANNQADQQAVDAALKTYVAEHKALPVYNRAQWLARAAAIAVGQMRIKEAVAHLKALKTMVDSADFAKEAFAHRRNADQSLQSYLQPVPGKLIGRQILNSKKMPDFDLYDLDVDLPGHPKGSTVTQETMTEEGYRIVPSDLITAKESKEAKERGPAFSPQMDLNDTPEARRTLSTTVPQSKRSTNDAYTQQWVIGTEDIRASKTHLNALVAAIKSYTMMSGKGGKDAVLDEFKQKAVDNLLWLYDLVPAAIRARAKEWYVGANRIATEWSAQDGYTDKQHAGVLAVLSPQKDWFMNVSLADRLRTIVKERAAFPWSPAMSAWADSYRASAKAADALAAADKFVDAGVRLEGLALENLSDVDAALFVRAYDQTYHERAYRTVTPEGEFTDYVINKQEVERDLFGDIPGVRGAVAWGSQGTIEKAISILRDGSNKNITTQLGNEHKVRNFYNNILEPHSTEGHVTIDTHAMAAAVMKAISANAKEVLHLFGRAGSNAETGASGSYGLIADVYREAARQRNVLPREMQSIAWEAVRGLFPRDQKKTLGPKVDAVWAQVKKGTLTPEQARARIFELAGGLSAFAWEKYTIGLSAAEGGRSFDTKPALTAETTAGGVLNIGLNVNDGSTISAQTALSALKLAGATVVSHRVKMSTTEPTLIVEVAAPLSPEKAAALSATLKQDAIAQRLPDGTGALYGPAADKWGPFNPEYFLGPEGDQPTFAPKTGAQVREALAAALPTTTSPQLARFLLPDGRRLTFSPDVDFKAHYALAQHAGVFLDQVMQSGVVRYAWPGGVELGTVLTTKQAETIVDDWAVADRTLTVDVVDSLGSIVNSHEFDVLNEDISPSFLQDWVAFNLEKGDTPRLNPKGTAKLVHYSRQEDLTEISPTYHGTGQIGAERLRQQNEGKAYIPRSFFYRAKTKIEPRFKGLTKYQVEVPESSLVDLATLKGTPTERERAAKKAGYKGYYNSESSMPNVVAMFESVMTTSGQPSPMTVSDLRADPLFSPRTWVSQIEKVLDQKMPKRASATQIKGILSPQNGIKPDELEAMGIDEYLASKETFDKHNVLEWAKAHQIQTEQVTFSDNPTDIAEQVAAIDAEHDPIIAAADAEVQAAKERLDASDSSNAHERSNAYYDALDKWNEATDNKKFALLHVTEAATSKKPKYDSWQVKGGKNYKEVFVTLPYYEAKDYVRDEAGTGWNDGHDAYAAIENPIVRLRTNDRTTTDGKKLLFLEEMQPPRKDEQEKMPAWALKRWREIGLKQALRMAAEGAYDAIGWTTGAQQADRYSLRKQVDRLTILLGDTRDGEFTYEVRAHTRNQNLVTRIVPASELPGVIGDELAARAIAEIPKSDFAMVTYKDLDLEMGGHGLAKVYDQDLVNAANGLWKKYGVKVGQSDVDLSGINGIDRSKVISFHTLPVTDAMKQVAMEGQPLFAPKPKQPKPAPTWTADQPGTLDAVIRVLQDKAIDIKRLTESVQKAGRVIPDQLNPVLAEEMYMKRSEQRAADFTNDELRPFVQQMQLAKVTVEQVDQYLQAHHILTDDVNTRLQTINPDLQGTPEFDRLAGMSDAEAKAILANASPAMAKLAGLAQKMVEKTRDLMVTYGLESQDRIDEWRKQYQAYVPLHREGFEETGHPTGTGRSVRGSTAKTRTGSGLAVTNVLANIAQARDQIITRGEKQRPVIAMAGLLMLHPNPDVATLDKPAQITMTHPQTGLPMTVPGNLTNYTVPTIRRFDPVSGTVKTYPDPTYKGRDNVVNFRVDGKDYAIVFNERNERAMEAAKAFKELDTPKLTGIMAAIAPYTRYLASVNTQYNPIFGIVNFVRDAQFAMLALGSTPLAGKKTEVLKNAIQSLSGIYQDARAVRLGRHPSSPTAQMWERFQHVGGPTGYRDLFFSSTDRAEEIRRMLEPNTLEAINSPQKFGKRMEETWLLKVLSDYNTTMENAIRLGVFTTAVQQGMSDLQAASYAKNITVNFNKKGQIGAQMGSLYAFFNANVQGTARIFETIFERTPTGIQLSAAGKKLVAGGLLVGVLQTFALAMAGFGDDEPPEYIKARNLVIPVPGTQKGYLLVPMPLGFNLLPNVGRAAAEAVRAGVEGKEINPLKRGTDLISAIYGTFSPLGGTGGPIQELMPTVADPLAAVVSNKDWTGKSISKEDRSTLDPTPGHTRVKDTASLWATALAKGINWATGGTEYRPGAASPTPDMIDYLVEQVTGGIGREMSKGSQVLQSMVTGEELPFYKVPLLGRFAGSAAGSTAVRSTFYDNVKAVNLAYREFEGRAKDRTGNAHEFLRTHPEGRLREAAISVERTIGELNKVKKDLVEQGAPRSMVHLRETQITGLMERFNEMVARQRTALPTE